MQNRLQSLDALRGLAALLVTLFHFTQDLPPTVLSSVGQYGWLGVSIFFVISGFIIPYAMHRAKYGFSYDFGRFLGKRFLRLHPPFLASIVLVIAVWHLSRLVPSFKGPVPSFPAQQLALHAPLLNGIVGVSWLQPVYWTLALEFQFYLLIGLLYPFLLRSKVALNISFVVLLLVALIPFGKPTSQIWIVPYLPLFVEGMAAAFLSLGRLTTKEFWVFTLTSTAVAFQTLSLPQAIACVATGITISFGQFTWPRPILWLGSISYSLYLIHLPLGGRIMYFARKFGISSLWQQCLCVSLATAASIFAAYWFYRWIEIPSQRLSSAVSFKASRLASKASHVATSSP